ncbi:hypothetical protein QR680_012370 [Steinernema hermaphroditum]|uniref:NF-kappa-B-activating protein C-terminal domain-containing protein n=1 Tax=Steinernema hermaphroditum TaxID=289476 RepID=A0AA39I1U1_9BILA|nr:hypothetical protein QR680_012370 [Steinernema hermaphroditum]
MFESDDEENGPITPSPTHSEIMRNCAPETPQDCGPKLKFGSSSSEDEDDTVEAMEVDEEVPKENGRSASPPSPPGQKELRIALSLPSQISFSEQTVQFTESSCSSSPISISFSEEIVQFTQSSCSSPPISISPSSKITETDERITVTQKPGPPQIGFTISLPSPRMNGSPPPARQRHERQRFADSSDDEKKEMNREEQKWEKRREERNEIAEHGCPRVWNSSPTHEDMESVYEEHDIAERRARKEVEKDEVSKKLEKREKDKKKSKKAKKAKKSKKKKKRHRDSESDSSSDEKSKKKKKKKRSRKHSSSEDDSESSEDEERRKKKKKRRRSESSTESANEEKEKAKKRRRAERKSESGDEWVEFTDEMRAEVEQKKKEEEAEMIGPAIPEELLARDQSSHAEVAGKADYGKDMLRGEAQAMAAYIAQGKRIPRRGEIGLSSTEISEFEKVGYVMSGTRHKSMEATRLRKENQVLTAEEKRLLSNFSQEERKKREELTLQQFRDLINSKKK